MAYRFEPPTDVDRPMDFSWLAPIIARKQNLALWEQEKERRRQEAELHQLKIEEAKDLLAERQLQAKQMHREAQMLDAATPLPGARPMVPSETAVGPQPEEAAPGFQGPTKAELGAPGLAPAPTEYTEVPPVDLGGGAVLPGHRIPRLYQAEVQAQKDKADIAAGNAFRMTPEIHTEISKRYPGAAALLPQPGAVVRGEGAKILSKIVETAEEQPQVRTETTVDSLTGIPSTKTIVTRKGGTQPSVTSAPKAEADKEPPPAALAVAPKAHAGADWTKHGQEFLDTLPLQIRPLVQKLGDYDQNPATLGRSQNKAMLLAMAAQYKPSYDDKLYTQRRQARLEFNSTKGGAGANIIALRTAVNHIGKLQELAPGLAGGDVKALNSLQNYIKTNFLGSPDVTNFQTAASAVESELASVMKKAGATDQEIKVWRENFGTNMSQRQIGGAVKTALDLMQGRADSIQDTWHTAMGDEEPDFPIFQKKQQDALARLRAGVSAPGGAAGRLAPPAVGEVRRGYRFKGGDPSKRESWEQVGP